MCDNSVLTRFIGADDAYSVLCECLAVGSVVFVRRNPMYKQDGYDAWGREGHTALKGNSEVFIERLTLMSLSAVFTSTLPPNGNWN